MPASAGARRAVFARTPAVDVPEMQARTRAGQPARHSRRRRRSPGGASAHASSATTTARTSRAPEARSVRAHSESVAPVVQTSSTRMTARGAASLVKAPRTFARRAPLPSPTWLGVPRARRRQARAGTPHARDAARARSAAWSKPRSRRRDAASGTGTSASARHPSASPRATARPSSAPSGSASTASPRYFSPWTAARSVPSKRPSATSARRCRGRGPRGAPEGRQAPQSHAPAAPQPPQRGG